MKTIKLMQEKNHFLEKFYSLNEKQLMLLSSGRFENLENFYNQREDILNIIRYIDSEMLKTQQNEDNMGLRPTYGDQINAKEALKIKDVYVSRILEQDIQILSLIDRLKNEVIKELKTVRHSKRAMAGYKSSAA